MKLASNIFWVSVISSMYLGCELGPSREDQNGTSDQHYRPAYHFTPPSQWMNDPNGMVYFDGEYHLFYQHYPDSNVWGPMHWGHAVSRDLVSWEHLPIALFPDSLGYIFSGSAVIDWHNSTGFGSGDIPPMVAIFTYHDPVGEMNGTVDFQTQGIAYSVDKGRSWVKYGGNPVLPNPGIRDFRDPKVFWSTNHEKWVMVLAIKDHVELFSSNDLINWSKLSDFGTDIGAKGGVWECPDLFELLDDEGNSRWVMLVSINPGGPQGGSATQYFIGQFDGVEFKADDDQIRWLDYGADNYAGVTWSDMPDGDERRIFIGWMSNWQYARDVPTYQWRSAMTLPRELILRHDKSGMVLASRPIIELSKLHLDTVKFVESVRLNSNTHLMTADFNNPNLVSIKWASAKNEQLLIYVDKGKLTIDRSRSGIIDFHPEFGAAHTVDISDLTLSDIQIYMDNSSLEVFVNDGMLVMTELLFPEDRWTSIEVEGLINSRIIYLDQAISTNVKANSGQP